MNTFQSITLYVLLFVGIYFQVFLLVTYVANRRKIKVDSKLCLERDSWPSVTIAVPVWNEEKTVKKTVESLLNLNYPKDKLFIKVVDDGSTDKTWSIIQQYNKNPQIALYHKENGGKHTAVNVALKNAATEFFGCLDADSFVDRDTLKKMICVFDDNEAMAVTPAMKIYQPTSTVQVFQSAEYIFGILVKKVMALVGGIHVTPGPFTIFRKETFEKIGPFRKAHNTEDMEIAFRMQANHLKIENCHTGWVYTTGPNTFKKLYKQRLRWTYGFIQNARDYYFLFFNPGYGSMGILTMPVGAILILGVCFTVLFLLYRIGQFLFRKYVQWRIVGFLWPHFQFSLFYISTKAHILLVVFIYLLMIGLVLEAHRLAEEKARLSKSVILYFLIYPFISPFWILKSIWNAIWSKNTSWR